MSLAKQPTSQLFSNDALTAIREAWGLHDFGFWADRSSQEPDQQASPPQTPQISGRAHGIPPDFPAPDPPASGPELTLAAQRPTSSPNHSNLHTLQQLIPQLAFRFRLLPGRLPGAKPSMRTL